MNSRCLGVTLLALAFACGCSDVADKDVDESSTYAPRTVIKKPLDPITAAPMFDAVTGSASIRDSDLVLAIEIDGAALAWPISMLCGPQREIINTEIEGRPIAATW